MKRITSIVESLVLTMLIIALGGGVALTTCSRNNTTELTLLSGRDGGCSEAMEADAGCCGMEQAGGNCGAAKACKAMPAKSCMSVKVLTLSPMAPGSHFVFHFINIPNLLANIEWRPLMVMIPRVGLQPMWWERTAFVSPPRVYLHLLRVLTI